MYRRISSRAIRASNFDLPHAILFRGDPRRIRPALGRPPGLTRRPSSSPASRARRHGVSRNTPAETKPASMPIARRSAAAHFEIPSSKVRQDQAGIYVLACLDMTTGPAPSPRAARLYYGDNNAAVNRYRFTSPRKAHAISSRRSSAHRRRSNRDAMAVAHCRYRLPPGRAMRDPASTISCFMLQRRQHHHDRDALSITSSRRER